MLRGRAHLRQGRGNGLPGGRLEYLSEVTDKGNKRVSELHVGNSELLFERTYICKPPGMKSCHLRSQGEFWHLRTKSTPTLS